MSGGKRYLALALVLFLALLPIFCSDGDFLTELETELGNLENSLIKLSTISQEQKTELKNLQSLQWELKTQVITLGNQLEESESQMQDLKEQSEKLKTQWEDLESSLKKSESDVSRLMVWNKILIGGICVTLAVSVVAVIVVAVK